MRNAILVLHRWVGIVIGLYVFLIGVTGIPLIFQEEAASAFRTPAVENPSGTLMDVDQVIAKLKQAYPGWHVHRLYWPEDTNSPWYAEVLKGDVGFLGETAYGVYLHPDQGTVLHAHDFGRSIWRVLQVVHINLISGRPGRTWNGVLALVTLFSVLTGLLMWLPLKRGEKALWRVNWSARPKRLNWELHQVTGAYLLVFFLMFCITGAYFAWGGQFVRAIAAVFPMSSRSKPLPVIQPVAETDVRPISSFLPSLHEQVPDYPVTSVLFQDAPNQPLRFTIYEGSRSEFYRASTLFYHPLTGELLRADLVRERLAGDSIVSWIAAVHFGAFGSWPIKVIWALAGLGFPLITITGVIIYVNKRSRRAAWDLEQQRVKATPS